ncbi:prepilin peptidase [Terrimesophilobacter mesophilus]|uniref:Prepilin leader peptidase/N-methyltransferase n=1 Tax=Terrimesophilobacter mesophilus TaxID=433647 RepID=A0A4R8V977_9MICO|nr:A24 family peptidase [Terrimesophilobacter mesophilus]TFB79711.1 prepilin peptidase [Terrimesophilobacter mesophilus]
MLASVVVPLVGVFGLLIGSFLNVVVYRVPAKRSIVSPPSACPHCGAPIRPGDNIPVVSWIVLRGKCRDCKAPISIRYPLVEFGTGVAFAGVALWFFLTQLPGGSSPSASDTAASALALVAYLYLAAISIALALIDIDTHTLPNRIVLPAYLVGAVLLGVSGLLAGDFAALATAAIGAAALFLFYFLLVIAYPRGMGMGDVKLAGVLGLFLGFVGWQSIVVGAFGAFLLGGVFSLVLVALRRASRKTAVPFGPWMLLGAWLGILFGNDIMSTYLGLFGIS